MRNLGITTIVIYLILAVCAYVFQKQIGDIRPALLLPTPLSNTTPAEQQTKQIAGEPVPFPLTLPDGLTIGIFANNLGNARDLTFSPGGTLVLSIPGSGKVVALPDGNNDGRANEIKDIATGLDRPHGIAFYNGKLFVVEEGSVVRYNWNEQELTATKDRELFTLPQGGRHFTRTITFNQKGQMFISLGSSCDVCFEKHDWLAAVIVSDADGNNPRLFAKGLRNAVFIAANPTTDELWGTEMGRDFLGDNLPPDEINIIRDGADYGWPICYGSRIQDTTFNTLPRKVRPCEATEAPVYEIAAHSAPLGLTFINSSQFPKDWQGDLLVAYHGSWNSSTPVGYKVVRLKVENNKVVGQEDFITGFLPTAAAAASGALGRPVDLAFDQQGSLYISDDKSGSVYKVIQLTP